MAKYCLLATAGVAMCILLIQGVRGQDVDVQPCSVAAIAACEDIVNNFTSSQSVQATALLPYPLSSLDDMHILCVNVTVEFKHCFEPVKAICSQYVVTVLQSTMNGLDFVCSGDSRALAARNRQCLASDDLMTRVKLCNDTFTEAKLELNRGGLQPLEYMQAGCRISSELLKCVRYQSWIACGQETAEWLHALDKLILNDTIQHYGCGRLDDDEPSGVGWSLLKETSSSWSPLLPQIIRLEGDPEVWIPKVQRGANISRKSISGDYSKFRFGRIAADYWNNRILWLNEARKSINYIPYWFTGASSTTNVFGALSGQLNDIAVDWFSQNVYITDSGHKWIVMASYNDDRIGRHRVVVSDNLATPTGIVTNPYKGYLYWADIGRHVIERSTLSGQERRVIVSHVPSPIDLAYDYHTDTLLVLDNSTNSIESYASDGTNKTRLIEYNKDDYDIIQIDVYKDYIFAIQTRGVMLVFQKSISNPVITVSLEGDAAPINSFGLAVFAADKQFPAENPCYSNNGGCDQICIPTTSTSSKPSKVCACTLGYVLQSNDHSCASEPLVDNFLLIADSIGRDIYMLDLDSDPTVIQSVPLDSNDVPLSLAFDPIAKKVFWLDGATNTLRRTALDGHTDETLYDFDTARIFEIAYDWQKSRVYYTDTHYQKIAYITVNGTSRTAQYLLYSAEPTDLALDIKNRVVYWSDWRTRRAKISRADMDYGNNTLTLVDTGLVLPGGLTVDVEGGKLFWCDAYHSRVEMAGVDGSHRTVLVEQSVGAAFFSIAVSHQFLYITDVNNRTLRRYNRETKEVGAFGPPEFQQAIAVRLVSTLMDGLINMTTTTAPTTPSTTTTTSATSLPTSSTASPAPPRSTTQRVTASPVTSSSTRVTRPQTTRRTTTRGTSLTTTPASSPSTPPSQSSTPSTKKRTKPTNPPTPLATTTKAPPTTSVTPASSTPTRSSTVVTPFSRSSAPSTAPTTTRPRKTKSSTPTTTPTAASEGWNTTGRDSALQIPQAGGLSSGDTAAVVIVVLLMLAVVVVAMVILYRKGRIPIRLPSRLRQPFQRFDRDPEVDNTVVIGDGLPLEKNESTA